jgi:hypothetical protein
MLSPPTTIDFIAFIVFGLALSITANRYYRRLAVTTGSVSTTKDVIDTFQRDLRRMPEASLDETRRRLGALFSRQQDPEAERLRRIALIFFGLSLLAFLAFPFTPGFA